MAIKDLENLLGLYESINTWVSDIASQVYTTLYEESSESIEWEFCGGDIDIRAYKDHHWSCSCCEGCNYRTFSFPALLVLQDQKEVDKYIASLK